MTRTKEEILFKYINKKFGRLIPKKLLSKNECPKNGYFLECLCDCGNLKITSVYSIDNKNTQSCGCLNKELSSNRKKTNLIGKKFGKLFVVEFYKIIKGSYLWKCECECGNVSFPTTRNLNKGNSTSCGCNLFRKGNCHPNWKNTISLEDRINKRSVVKNPLYSQWIKDVLKKYHYECFLTQSKINLQVHHLYSWNAYPDLRYDINNGVVLSKSIHILFHKKYGKGNNTSEQFKDFVKNYNDHHLENKSCASGACTL
jgi:hypothetical protein